MDDTKWARHLSNRELEKLSADKNIAKDVNKEIRRRAKEGINVRRARRT